MANLTLAIDDALLPGAREAALRQHTTVNAMVRDFLGRYVEARSRRLEALEQFEAVAAGAIAPAGNPGAASLCTSAPDAGLRCGCLLTPTFWAYRLDRREAVKSEQVRQWLVEVMADHEVVISTQVLIELRSVARAANCNRLSHCALLFSEDFSHGRRIAGLEVVNPLLG